MKQRRYLPRWVIAVLAAVVAVTGIALATQSGSAAVGEASTASDQ